MGVLSDYKQPANILEMILNRAAMAARRREIGEKRLNQSATVAELQEAYEQAKGDYKETLRASVIGTKTQAQADEARAVRDQLKERLEEETEMLEACETALRELTETIGADFNEAEIAKKVFNREFSDQHMKRVKARFDEAAADYIALRYLCGRIDVAAQELVERVAVAENRAVQDAKVAAKAIDAIPDKQAEVA